MEKKQKNTVFTNISNAIGLSKPQPQERVGNFSLNRNDVIFKTKDKEEFEKVKLEKQQQNYLSQTWRNTGRYIAQNTAIVESNRLMMYRDANLMDNYPLIGAALDLYSEESCTINEKGKILNIYSSSPRIKSVLEDLFVNKLDIHVNLPLWTRNMCKYGDTFLMLNINNETGVEGSRMLPIDEIDRIEPDYFSPYQVQNSNVHEVEFMWKGVGNIPNLKEWQMAHFRLLNDSMFLPYGVSILSKARRHWRLLTMMEDLLLIYRLERSVERRVFKVYVGNIDDADVQAYIDTIANEFKRAEIVDPQTGQIDLRKNIMGVDQDIFIPTRSENASNPVDVLPTSNNLNTTDDLKFFEEKLISALRVPKAFLGFDETVGDGANLAMLDVRFERSINRIQQSLIMELNKIALIHLYLQGFTDELNDFVITLNNPSTQSEILKLDLLAKKITIFKDAVTDNGNGIPPLSWNRACRDILKFSNDEILEIVHELRLEKALSVELSKTEEIIRKTGVFDKVDRLYGEPNATYSTGEGEDGGDSSFSGGGGGGSLGGLGGDSLDFGDDMGGDDDFGGDSMEGEPAAITPDDAIDNIESDSEPLGENKRFNTDDLIIELRNRIKNEHHDYVPKTNTVLYDMILKTKELIK